MAHAWEGPGGQGGWFHSPSSHRASPAAQVLARPCRLSLGRGEKGYLRCPPVHLPGLTAPALPPKPEPSHPQPIPFCLGQDPGSGFRGLRCPPPQGQLTLEARAPSPSGTSYRAREGVLTLTQGLGADMPAHLGPTRSLGPPWSRRGPGKVPSSSRLRMAVEAQAQGSVCFAPQPGPQVPPGTLQARRAELAAGATGGTQRSRLTCMLAALTVKSTNGGGSALEPGIARRVLPDFRVGLTFLPSPRPPATGRGEEPAQGWRAHPSQGLAPSPAEVSLEEGSDRAAPWLPCSSQSS